MRALRLRERLELRDGPEAIRQVVGGTHREGGAPQDLAEDLLEVVGQPFAQHQCFVGRRCNVFRQAHCFQLAREGL